MSIDLEAMARDIHSALTDVIGRHSGESAFVTRFFVCAEVVDHSGERALWMSDTPDAKVWDSLGLAAFAHAKLTAQAGQVDPEDDG